MGKANDPKVEQAHIKNLGNGDGEVRREAIAGLMGIGKTDGDVPELLEACIQNLEYYGSGIRGAAAEALKKLGKANDPKVVQAHIKNLGNWDAEVRREAIAGLIDIGKTDVPELLAACIRNLEGYDKEIREAAAEALKKLGKANDPEIATAIAKIHNHSGSIKFFTRAPNENKLEEKNDLTAPIRPWM